MGGDKRHRTHQCIKVLKGDKKEGGGMAHRGKNQMQVPSRQREGKKKRRVMSEGH